MKATSTTQTRKSPKPQKYRNGYRAQVSFPGTKTRLTKYFTEHYEAKQWIKKQLFLRELESSSGRLGGPFACTLAEFLIEYAEKVVAFKAGYVQEINRINTYLEAAGLPRLKVAIEGKVTKVTEIEEARSENMSEYLSGKRSDIEPVLELKAYLATKKCSELAKDDFAELISIMSACGNSPSTIQKEIALIRAAFNTASEQWGWENFENPAAGFTLGKSRVVIPFISDEQVKNLIATAHSTEKVVAAVAIEFALQTLLRKGALLNLKWQDIDLHSEKIKVPVKKAKSKGMEYVFIPLGARAIELLKTLSNFGGMGRVFEGLSSDALDGAFERVRERVGLTALRFHDLRHLGATQCARAGMQAHQLSLMLGHKGLHMALIYVNLATQDTTHFLNAMMGGSTIPA